MKCPVLAINGSLDLQVLPQSLEGIESALEAGGNQHYTIKLFEGKNHMFQSSSGTLKVFDLIGKVDAKIRVGFFCFVLQN